MDRFLGVACPVWHASRYSFLAAGTEDVRTQCTSRETATPHQKDVRSMKTSLATPAIPTVRTKRRLGFRNAAVCVALLVVSSVFANPLAGTADAGIVVNIEEQGSDVVASYSGSIDITGIGFNNLATANTNRIAAFVGQVNFQNHAAKKASLTDFGKTPCTVAPSAFGTGSFSFDVDTVSVAAGNAFGFQANGFFIEPTYVSGSTISGSMTFENQTLASMGINVGVGIMNATFSSGNTLTVNAVPEPTSLALLFTGVAGWSWRRPRSQPGWFQNRFIGKARAGTNWRLGTLNLIQADAGLLANSSRPPYSSRCGRDDSEAAGYFVSMNAQDCRDGFDTSLNREPGLPKKDDSTVCQLLAVDQVAKVLVGGQQDGAVRLSEGENLLVIRSGHLFGDRDNLVSRKAQPLDDAVVNALVSDQFHADRRGIG